MCFTTSFHYLCYFHNNTVRWGYKHFIERTCLSLFTDSSPPRLLIPLPYIIRMHLVAVQHPFFFLFSPLHCVYFIYFLDPMTLYIEVKEKESAVVFFKCRTAAKEERTAGRLLWQVDKVRITRGGVGVIHARGECTRKENKAINQPPGLHVNCN